MRQKWSRWRQQMVGCGGGKQGQGNIASLNAGIAQRHIRRACSKVAQRFVGHGPATAPDAGAPFDPARFQAQLRLDLGIFNPAVGNGMAEPGQPAGTDRHLVCPAIISTPCVMTS